MTRKTERLGDGWTWLSRRLRVWTASAFILGWGATAGAGDPLPPDLAPDLVEGTLWAAECIAMPASPEGCSAAAFAEGKPGGLLAKERFTLLLVDGRALGKVCTGGPGRPATVRAQGILHGGDTAMSVFRLEASCGPDWVAVDLPHSGVVGNGAEGGDE